MFPFVLTCFYLVLVHGQTHYGPNSCKWYTSPFVADCSFLALTKVPIFTETWTRILEDVRLEGNLIRSMANDTWIDFISLIRINVQDNPNSLCDYLDKLILPDRVTVISDCVFGKLLYILSSTYDL